MALRQKNEVKFLPIYFSFHYNQQTLQSAKRQLPPKPNQGLKQWAIAGMAWRQSAKPSPLVMQAFALACSSPRSKLIFLCHRLDGKIS